MLFWQRQHDDYRCKAVLVDDRSPWCRRLLTSARMIVGLPIISSSRNLNFWLGLTGAKGGYIVIFLSVFGFVAFEENPDDVVRWQEKKLRPCLPSSSKPKMQGVGSSWSWTGITG